ncbi:dynactin subunit 4 [Absidia repens]|uniref:Dynactin subunit 4 n=1 Tax=Absidia repens TaxID=90262 RepID=A0A1X2I6P7_9FUNG|nr:dynactin subunit 4 [Absidia repens]
MKFCHITAPTVCLSEQNRCARNCFQCPICCNTLAVMASQEITPISSSAPNSSTYFLACNVCRWNSQEIGMVFEKPTSLASQLQKNEKALPDVQEFDHLKEHFDKHLRVNAAPPSLSSLLSFSSSGNINKFIGGGGSNIYSELHHSANELHHQQVQRKLDDITTYEASVQVPNKDVITRESLMGLRNMDRISTLVQRCTQLHDQPYQVDQLYPQRIHLCVKRSKRCRTCRHILIKPEQKAQTTRFKIKLVAMNHIPTITIINIGTASEAQQQQQPLVLNPGIATQFALKFTNPLYEEISVTLATPQLVGRTPSFDQAPLDNSPPSAVNGCVTILSPHFTVNAYNETIEYDDEMDHLGGHDPKIPSASWTTGIYEKRSNSTSVIIEAIPKKPGEFKFPLLVTCNYRSDEDRMDISSGDIDQDEIDNVDMDSSLNGSRKANSSIRMDDEKTKHYSFWCLVDLGEVCS